jgi:hypothetical protein
MSKSSPTEIHNSDQRNIAEEKNALANNLRSFCIDLERRFGLGVQYDPDCSSRML